MIKLKRRKAIEQPTPESGGGLYFSSAKENIQFINSGCTLLDCVLGGGWPLGRIVNIVGDKCLSGDTVVSVGRGVRPRKMTIKTLWRRANGSHPNRNPKAETTVLVDLGGYVGMHRMLSVQKTGSKVLYEVTDVVGNSIEVSEDHKFKTQGGWKTIAAGLSVGVSVYCWHGKKTGKQARPDRAVTYSIPYHPHAWQHIVAGRNYKRGLTARLVIEAAMNNLSFDDFVRIIRFDAETAQRLAYSDPALDVHHLDGNPCNDEIGNLELLVKSDHWQEHAHDLIKNTHRTVLVEIKSIRRVGLRPTFDITMEAPHNNFIANGFVVHNSTGKTLLAMEAIANFFRQYPKGYCWYNEAESAFDADYAKALGIPFDRVTFIQDCNTVEELFNSVNGIVLAETEDDSPGLYIMDSLDSLSDAAEMERDIEKGNYGAAKAKMLSEFFRRVTKGLAKSNVCLMIISQVRDAINASMFAEKHTRSGGRALDFYASIVLWLANVGKIKQTKNKIERVVGVHIRANCKKNKVALPYRQCDFDVTFGFGIEDEKASLAFLKEVGKPIVANLGAESLRDLVIQEWFRIEASFIPARRKYGGEDE